MPNNGSNRAENGCNPGTAPPTPMCQRSALARRVGGDEQGGNRCHHGAYDRHELAEKCEHPKDVGGLHPDPGQQQAG